MQMLSHESTLSENNKKSLNKNGNTFIQTRDKVDGLYNYREFSQRLECLYQAMQTQEKSSLLLL